MTIFLDFESVKKRKVKNWCILLQKLDVIFQPDRKNKWSELY